MTLHTIDNSWSETWISLTGKAFNDGDVWAQLARAYSTFFYTSYGFDPSGNIDLYNLTATPYPDPEDVLAIHEQTIQRQVKFLIAIYIFIIAIIKSQPMDRGDGLEWQWGKPGTKSNPVPLTLRSDFIGLMQALSAIQILAGNYGDFVYREEWHNIITVMRLQFDDFQFIYAEEGEGLIRVKIDLYNMTQPPETDVLTGPLFSFEPMDYSYLHLSTIHEEGGEDFPIGTNVKTADGGSTYKYGALTGSLLQSGIYSVGSGPTAYAPTTGVSDCTTLMGVGYTYRWVTNAGTHEYQTEIPSLPNRCQALSGGKSYPRFVLSAYINAPAYSWPSGYELDVYVGGEYAGRLTDSNTITFDVDSGIPAAIPACENTISAQEDRGDWEDVFIYIGDGDVFSYHAQKRPYYIYDRMCNESDTSFPISYYSWSLGGGGTVSVTTVEVP